MGKSAALASGTNLSARPLESIHRPIATVARKPNPVRGRLAADTPRVWTSPALVLSPVPPVANWIAGSGCGAVDQPAQLPG